MFISFFSGKVMLFFGISLIMKEKSNASALGADANASGGRFDNRHRSAIWKMPSRRAATYLSAARKESPMVRHAS